MDEREYALLILEWEEAAVKLSEIEDRIAAEALRREKSQSVGNVKVTYTSRRGRYDYERAAFDAGALGEEVVGRYTTTEVKTDWKRLCEDEGVDVQPYYEMTSGPSVSIRLVK